jgi:uncharacterized protein YukE
VSYTISQIRGSKPESLVTASTDADDSAKRVDAQIAQSRRQFGELATAWTGKAAQAAQDQNADLARHQEAYRDRLLDVKDVLALRGPRLVDLRSNLDSAVDDAEDWWIVGDDGSVVPGVMLTWFAKLSDETALIVRARQLDVESKLKLLIAQFEAEDKATAYELRSIGWNEEVAPA